MIGQLLAWLGSVWYIVIWSLGLLGYHVARSRYNGKDEAPRLNENDAPGVSILRPLRGFDCNLYGNLESSFRQQYPKFEIIFSVAEEGDVAIPIVRELMAKYPDIDASLIVGEDVVGINPKINNLVRSFDAAKYDILWVIDSNVLTKTSTLARSVEALNAPPAKAGGRTIGLVHHLPFAIYPDDNLGSRVEQVFLCSTHAKMYLAINYVAVDSCVNGKSCLYRKSDVVAAAAARKRTSSLKLDESRDGLASFGQYLGEDNMLGEAVWHELGQRHAMGSEVAGNAVGSMSFETYCRRRVRWIRVRKYMVTASTLVEPLTECFACAILGAWAFRRLVGIPPWLLISVHVIAWLALDIKIFDTLARSSPSPNWHKTPHHDGPSSIVPFVRAWLVRELMAFPIWSFAMLGDTVTWRSDGKVYKVRRDGTVRLLRSDESEAWVERALAYVQRRFFAGRRNRYVTMTPEDEELYGNGRAHVHDAERQALVN